MLDLETWFRSGVAESTRMSTQESTEKQPSPAGASSAQPELNSPLLKEPWRRYRALAGDKWPQQYDKELLKQISKCEEKVNILFIGQIQSGKSSTINSLMSTVNGRITDRAKAGQSDTSMTIQLNAIHGIGPLQNISFFDLMGLEVSEDRGLQKDDIVYATKGQIKLGSEVNRRIKFLGSGTVTYNIMTSTSLYLPSTASITIKLILDNFKEIDIKALQNPGIEQEELKIHCVIYIVDGENIGQGMTKDFKKKIDNIEALLKIGPNRVVVVTKVDNICPEVKKDIQKIFYSQKVETAVENASKFFGVSKNKVYPVMNYVDAVEIDEYTNIPLLLALKSAIEFGVDFIHGQRYDNCPKKQEK